MISFTDYIKIAITAIILQSKFYLIKIKMSIENNVLKKKLNCSYMQNSY